MQVHPINEHKCFICDKTGYDEALIVYGHNECIEMLNTNVHRVIDGYFFKFIYISSETFYYCSSILCSLIVISIICWFIIGIFFS